MSEDIGHALSGVRVVALEQAAAGPFATHLLADMGAEVIKIERPGSGDVIRGWDEVVRGLSSGFVWLNRSKRSIVVDAKRAGGTSVLRRLVSTADVFLENLSPGVVDRLGLGYETAMQENERLVYCRMSGYGATGPYRDAKAYDLLIQGETGIMATTGFPDAPAKVGVPISDITAGVYAALGVTMALLQRERTGRGQLVDIAMFDVMLEALAYFPHYWWHLKKEPPRAGMRHHAIVPYGPFHARDGRYVNIAVASDRDWAVLCEVIERTSLLHDVRFATVASRNAHRSILEPMVEAALLERDSHDWVERLRAAGLPVGEVRSIEDVVTHPQVAARALIRAVDSPVGPVPTIESALHLSDSPVSLGSIPLMGADTTDVLQDAGYSVTEIQALREQGVI